MGGSLSLGGGPGLEGRGWQAAFVHEPLAPCCMRKRTASRLQELDEDQNEWDDRQIACQFAERSRSHVRIPVGANIAFCCARYGVCGSWVLHESEEPGCEAVSIHRASHLHRSGKSVGVNRRRCHTGIYGRNGHDLQDEGRGRLEEAFGGRLGGSRRGGG